MLIYLDLHQNIELIRIFPPKSIFSAYRRTKNLKELLAPSKLSSNTVGNQNSEEAKGCFKCNKKRCDLCQHYLIQDTKFQSFACNRIYRINQQLSRSCTSKNVIYLASCNLSRKQYVRSTSTEFKVRFRNHKSSMINNKKTCELAIHFNCSHHEIHQISFIIIEKITKAAPIWNNFCSRGKPIGLRSSSHCNPMVLTKDVNLNKKNRICYNKS